MNIHIGRSRIILGLALIAASPVGTALAAECALPDATGISNVEILNDSTSVFSTGGSVDSCPTGQVGVRIDNSNGTKSVYWQKTDDGNNIIEVITGNVTSSPKPGSKGPADWSATIWHCPPDYNIGNEADECLQGGLDSIIVQGQQAGNGCFTALGNIDAISGKAGAIGVKIRDLIACTDLEREAPPEPEPEPAPVAQCYLPDDSATINIDGVEIGCPTVPTGEKRMIFVAKKTVACEPDEICYPGQKLYPGYGFLDPETGDVTLDNICICYGAGYDAGQGEDAQCDPAPEIPNGAAIDALPPCEIAGGTPPPTSIDIINPTCVTSGGRRRCY